MPCSFLPASCCVFHLSFSAWFARMLKIPDKTFSSVCPGRSPLPQLSVQAGQRGQRGSHSPSHRGQRGRVTSVAGAALIYTCGAFGPTPSSALGLGTGFTGKPTTLTVLHCKRQLNSSRGISTRVLLLTIRQTSTLAQAFLLGGFVCPLPEVGPERGNHKSLVGGMR